MSYWANPFDSKAGLMVQKEIFDSLFLDDGKTGFRSREHTAHFEKAFFQGRNADMVGVTALRCFTLVYDDYDRAMSDDSGIYCCGECGRTDHLWNWEFIDFGFYSSFGPQDNTWLTGEYEPKKMTTGIYSGTGYGIIAQVRCNEVSSCTHCGITVQAPLRDVTTCPECGRGPAASDPDKLGMIQAGCGSMGSVFHSVPPVTSDQVYTITAEVATQSPRVNFVTLVAAKSLTVRVPKTIRPNTMRIEWTGDNTPNSSRQGQQIIDKRQAMTWVPNLVMTLPVDSGERGGASNPLRFPISMFGGFSNKESPLYPGMTAFGGSHITKITRQDGREYQFYLTGYRTPSDGSGGNMRSWTDVGDVAGYVNTERTQSRVKVVPANGDTSRNNRPYHLTQYSIYMGDGSQIGGYSGGVSVEKYGGGRSSNPTERTRNYTDRLPVMRFRTEQPDASGRLIDGTPVGFKGKPKIRYVNLLNPNIRDIDDSGMVRVAAQTIKPIPDVPSILDDEDPPIPGIGLVCPNDVVAAMEYHFYMTDVQDGLVAQLRRVVEEWSKQTSSSGSDPTGYPWGVSDIGQISNDDVRQMLTDFGITTPATAPGSFYSYIITLQKARAVAEVGGRFYPAFTTRRRLPVAYRGSLEPADMFGYTGSAEETLFYALHGGSGNRRDGNVIEPTRYPRFGSVIPNAELVEDPLHPTGFTIPPPNCTIVHDVQTLPKGTSLDTDQQMVFKTHKCNTCMATQDSAQFRGTILNQFQQAIADLEVDDYGWPVNWTFIPNNRLGLEDWMIAVHVAYEDNRKFEICPDPIVTVTPAADPTDPPTLTYDPYVGIPDPNGIADFRTGVRMSFVPLSVAETMPEWVSTDLTGASRVSPDTRPETIFWRISGETDPLPFPQPRFSYIMSAHGDHSDYSPLLNIGDGMLRSLAPNGPFYRDTGSGTYSPIMYGIMLDGKRYTAGLSGLAATGGTGGVP